MVAQEESISLPDINDPVSEITDNPTTENEEFVLKEIDITESEIVTEEDTSSLSENSESESLDIDNVQETNDDKISQIDNQVFSLDVSNYMDQILTSIIVIVVSILIYLVIHFVFSKAAESLNIKEKRVKGIDSLLKTILIILSSIIVLFQFSTVSATIAGFISIALGSVIGFSSRNTISNAIAGIILLSSRPFKLGDLITAGNDNSFGNVVEITLIYTKIRTIRNELVTIPNQILLQNKITNYSGFKLLAISIQVSAGYNENQDQVKQLLIDAANQTYGVLTNPKAYIVFKRLGDFAAIYELIVYTNKPNLMLKIKSDMRTNVCNIFKEAKIDLTTPRLVGSYRFDEGKDDEIEYETGV